MKTFCIYYPTDFGKAEYWVSAYSAYAAKVIFINAYKRGDLDYPCTNLDNIEIKEAY